MANKIRFRRGPNAGRTFKIVSGEPVWVTDTKKLYIGDASDDLTTGTDGGILIGPQVAADVPFDRTNTSFSGDATITTVQKAIEKVDDDAALKAPLNSPALTGSPTAPTPGASDNSTAIATTAFVKGQGYYTSSDAATAATANKLALRDANGRLQVSDPSAATDATNKQYVDGKVDAAIFGLDLKGSVKVATTANITLSGAQTIDTIAVVAGDRVLVKNQTDGKQNGIYVVASGAWTRATDSDGSDELTTGAYVYIEQGTNAGTQWAVSTTGTITIGTTSITWTQLTGPGSVIGGNGITQSGNTLSIVSAAGTAGSVGTINVTADAIGVSLGTTSTTAAAGNHNHDTTYLKKAAGLGNDVVLATDASGNVIAHASVSGTELAYLNGVDAQVLDINDTIDGGTWA